MSTRQERKTAGPNPGRTNSPAKIAGLAVGFLLAGLALSQLTPSSAAPETSDAGIRLTVSPGYLISSQPAPPGAVVDLPSFAPGKIDADFRTSSERSEATRAALEPDQATVDSLAASKLAKYIEISIGAEKRSLDQLGKNPIYIDVPPGLSEPLTLRLENKLAEPARAESLELNFTLRPAGVGR